MTEAIHMQGVIKHFPNQIALNGIDWIVPQGTIHGLIGANGSGKTTLLRLALGLLWPDSGEISIMGQPFSRDDASLRQRVHYVGTGTSKIPPMRVNEWVRYASLLYERWDAKRCARLLSILEISSKAYIGRLSLGTETQLQLLVAISARPDLLLMDEPTNGLDAVVKRQVLQLIIDMAAQEGTTVVMASHAIEDIERLADTLAVLYRGRFTIKGDVDTIKAQFHRVQAVLNRPLPETVKKHPQLLHVEQRGHIAVLTFEGNQAFFLQQLQNVGATHLEPIAMDLTDVFRCLMEKEGYTRDSLTLKSL